MDPLVIRKDLPEASKAKVLDFFYSYGKTSPQEKENLLKLNNLSGFKPSTNSQLIPIRQLELFKTRNKFENDADLSADEKQTKLADIDKQLAALAQAK